MKPIKAYQTCEYPSQWDDLINLDKEVIATISTTKEASRDKRKKGIIKAGDGIYDIVVEAKEINDKIVKDAIENLSKVTGKKYEFTANPILFLRRGK